MLRKTLLTTLLVISCLLGMGTLKAQKTLPYSYDFEFSGTYNEANAKAALTAEGWTLTNASNNSYIRRYMYNNSYSFEFLVDESKDYQYLISPLLSDASALSIEFYWKTTASTTVKYKIGYSKSDTPDVTNSFTWSDEVTCTWQSAYTLASQAFHTDGIKYIAIMFDRNGDTSTNHYLAIDDITISQYVAPTNLAASALVTSASISWNAGSDETNWLLYYSTNNSAPSASIVTPSDNVKAVSGNPTYTITGLTDGTTYYAWVRSKYSNDNYSSWVGPVELQTSSNKTFTANDGTASVYYVPIAGYNVTSMTKSQFIIPSTDLEDMIGSNVTRLTFYTTTGSKTWGDATFKIYMKEVENTVFASTDFESFTDDYLCYNGSLSVDASKLMEITLSNAYKYNGGNLLVYFCLDNTGTNTSCTFYGIDTEDYSSLYHYGTGTTYLKRDKHLPKITFTYTYAETYDTDGNWPTSGAPAATDNVLVQSNITITSGTNATAHNIDIEGGSLTIANGSTLTCNDINTVVGAVIIADGGQLICNNAVNATLQKEIDKASSWNTTGADGWYFIASPVNGFSTSTIATGTSTSDLYSYNEPTCQWFNAQGSTNPFTTLTRGQGYLYANFTGNDLAFTGEMPATNTNIVMDLSYAYDGNLKGFNLMGNPFTCNLTNTMVKIKNADESITTITSYYIVENDEELTLVDNFSENPIKPGRGFLIQATGEGQKLVFNPSGAKSEESSAKPSFITIEAGNEQFMDRACIQIGNGNTLRKMTINNQVSHVYVMNDGKDYAATTVTELQNDMPVYFEVAQNGQYTISVNTENVEMNYLHLIDNMTGADVDLLQTPSYTFNARTTDYASRFRLVFSANGVNDINVENDLFAFIDNDGQLIVNGEGTLQVFDVLGRQLLTKELTTANCQLPTVNSPGVYMIRLTNGNETKTQKIIVK